MKVILKNKPYRVSFKHNGFDDSQDTLCVIRDEDGEIAGIGQAFLNPLDNFCKATGRRVSLKRALEGFSNESRRTVWTQYFKEHKDLQKREDIRLSPETLDALLDLTKGIL